MAFFREKCYFSWKPPVSCVPCKSVFSMSVLSPLPPPHLLAQCHKHVLSNYALCTLFITHPTNRAVKQVSACYGLSMFWEFVSVVAHNVVMMVLWTVLCFISNGREETENTCWWTVSKQAVNSPWTCLPAMFKDVNWPLKRIVKVRSCCYRPSLSVRNGHCTHMKLSSSASDIF
jgi:hypothetical protein